ncbi:hypothetical protein BGK55_19865 [Xanthomonas citri pv. malvacearum]|nr:hypothetical protein BGK55_19865 [Xanthomonas citri pv. malvacearum]ASM99617.1 hypothetical protein APY29_01850 [Xanthomonas citri pv. malvacearum]ASN07809.1 hypothetical protein APY30_01680 [Xanthomonas citri pv. malvacearum]OOW95598.1 hypothetical protein Xmlv_08360 [Xanthomonas citri pv. malvacearum]
MRLRVPRARGERGLCRQRAMRCRCAVRRTHPARLPLQRCDTASQRVLRVMAGVN